MGQWSKKRRTRDGLVEPLRSDNDGGRGHNAMWWMIIKNALLANTYSSCVSFYIFKRSPHSQVIDATAGQFEAEFL